MQTYDFAKPITDLEGKEITDVSATPPASVQMNKLLAQALANAAEGPALKFYEWSKALYKDGKLPLDSTDADILKAFIEGHKSLTNLAKGQMLILFRKTA